MITRREPSSRARALQCVNASLEKKAKDIVVLNVKEISAFADYFIICSGTSDRQVRAIAESIQERMKTVEILPLGIEGEIAGQWILMDYGDVIVHVFLDTVRTFYDMERLWSEAPRLDISDDTVALKTFARRI